MSPEIFDDGLPNISSFKEVEDAVKSRSKNVLSSGEKSKINFGGIKSATAVALHMHQPLIPAGGHDLGTADIISNLQHMMDNQGVGDNHNAPVFHWCYKRIGEFIPQLIGEGKEPRVMLEYSGELLFGLRKMGLHDVFDSLKHITCDPNLWHTVEWLGCPWGHAVAPSTPFQDYRLHVKAWQSNFAAIFGIDALKRVRGFSPSEMALPNHPDIAYEFVKTLKECGFTWVLVQEHTVERPDNGHGPDQKYVPNRLVCKNSKGEEVSITAIIKTQGSDTKLVAQMQPYYEAKSMARTKLAGKDIPQLVAQIADGENGGVMMNEFPPMFNQVAREASGTDTPMMNVTEYLEHLEAMGITEKDFPVIQPAQQKKIWDKLASGGKKLDVAQAIEELKKEDGRFNMDGGSWTNDLSWVKGYQNVLDPMNQLSAKFAQKVLTSKVSPDTPKFRNALYYLLVSQTSCFRYWGQGTWTDYARELCRRGIAIIDNDF
ncbi:MAG: glycosyl hydrolase family 57 [Chitinispirillia bacterium]|nr:glycosyl hydrolase family 57 [Chitinispirillia bacterium]MCL2268080.1 glycosyl hydrolase family 57 [Chitinispirillia bacterium]